MDRGSKKGQKRPWNTEVSARVREGGSDSGDRGQESGAGVLRMKLGS